MKSTSDELAKLRLMSEKYLSKTDKLDKLLTQIEAKIRRAEERHFSDDKPY